MSRSNNLRQKHWNKKLPTGSEQKKILFYSCRDSFSESDCEIKAHWRKVKLILMQISWKNDRTEATKRKQEIQTADIMKKFLKWQTIVIRNIETLKHRVNCTLTVLDFSCLFISCFFLTAVLWLDYKSLNNITLKFVYKNERNKWIFEYLSAPVSRFLSRKLFFRYIFNLRKKMRIQVEICMLKGIFLIIIIR